MASDVLSDERILCAWERNAQAWTDAVRRGAIATRRQVTDQAIIEAVLKQAPISVLDIGCGEGWLARALTARQITVIGVDGVPALIEAAQLAGGGSFYLMTYDDLAAGRFGTCVDAVVCNFSLLGNESVTALLRALPDMLSQDGCLFVQTLHPLEACGELPYQDGWRNGSWDGFSSKFKAPAPWYFRTLASWIDLLGACGFHLLEIQEPLHPESQRPASVIFVAQRRPI